MRVCVDTNVLVRAAVRDDRKQADAAAQLLKQAEIIAVSSSCLCEFVWVLKRVYGLASAEASSAIKALLDTENVVVNRPAVEAGLVLLDAGGDFADGVIAFEGHWLGGQTFVSFDEQAVKLLDRLGQDARHLK